MSPHYGTTSRRRFTKFYATFTDIELPQTFENLSNEQFENFWSQHPDLHIPYRNWKKLKKVPQDNTLKGLSDILFTWVLCEYKVSKVVIVFDKKWKGVTSHTQDATLTVNAPYNSVAWNKANGKFIQQILEENLEGLHYKVESVEAKKNICIVLSRTNCITPI